MKNVLVDLLMEDKAITVRSDAFKLQNDAKAQ